MKLQTKIIIAIAILVLYVISMISFASAILIDAEYVTIYPGEQGGVDINVENNENFDIEDVSVSIVLSSVSPTGQIVSLPFSVVGSSEKSLDDLDEDDDDSATFTIRADNDITPGSYNIPYIISYTNKDSDEKKQKQGTFGLRVSAKTDLDFSVETQNNVLGTKGRLSLEIINRGLGNIKSVQVEITPEGYELISSKTIFVGNVNPEDSELVSFDVIFKDKNANLNAKISYKDFDNEDKVENVKLPVKVYTREEALEFGLIKKSNTGIYFGVIIVLIIIWFIYRGIRKRQKRKNRESEKNGR